MRMTLLLLVVGLILVACSNEEAPAEHRTTATSPADFTVVSKRTDPPKYFVTILLYGTERETEVPSACYRAAHLGEPLPARVDPPPAQGSETTTERVLRMHGYGDCR